MRAVTKLACPWPCVCASFGRLRTRELRRAGLVMRAGALCLRYSLAAPWCVELGSARLIECAAIAKPKCVAQRRAFGGPRGFPRLDASGLEYSISTYYYYSEIIIHINKI